jgi:hypothetical protein
MITVSGQAPLLDVTNTAQQAVFTREVVEALPVGKHAGLFLALIRRQTKLANLDVAGTNNEQAQNFSVYGGGTIAQPRRRRHHWPAAAIQEVNVQREGP